MINLLPPEATAAIHFGRRNTVLRTWLLGFAAAIAGLIIILFAGGFYMDRQAKDLQTGLNVTNQELKAENLSQVQADAKQITGDIRVIDTLLSKEIRFSDLIQAIGTDMPANTVLDNLTLNNKVSGALDLTANAKDYTSAAQVAVNLSNSQNSLFSKVDIISIDCNSSSSSAYKCTATMRALFSKTAQTKFLSVPSGSTP